jgi:hypothetical protein
MGRHRVAGGLLNSSMVSEIGAPESLTRKHKPRTVLIIRSNIQLKFPAVTITNKRHVGSVLIGIKDSGMEDIDLLRIGVYIGYRFSELNQEFHFT